MDLGFAGLIEEIEKRFGKTVTTFVIGCLLIAIVMWTLETVVTIAAEMTTLRETGTVIDTLLAILYQVGITGLVVMVALAYLKLRTRTIRCSINLVANQVEQYMEQLEQQEKEREQKLSSYKERVDQYRQEYETARDELQTKMDEVNSLLREKDKHAES